MTCRWWQQIGITWFSNCEASIHNHQERPHDHLRDLPRTTTLRNCHCDCYCFQSNSSGISSSVLHYKYTHFRFFLREGSGTPPLPYNGSPTSGCPYQAVWMRIWCGLPAARKSHTQSSLYFQLAAQNEPKPVTIFTCSKEVLLSWFRLSTLQCERAVFPLSLAA